MTLSDLAAYAEEKLHIREQHKWADFPGFSVLADPVSGKWIALLMRQWDYETGREIERCDIKCGQGALGSVYPPYLSPPFRMKGRQWVGVRMGEDADPERVFRLLDKAARSDRGYTVVLDEGPARLSAPYGDTPLLFTAASLESADPDAPEQILEMRKLYEYGDGSFRQKNKNFYRQGKYMARYTDDQPWPGQLRRYFPCYHDLNLPQLRGYFTWRTRLRAGDWQPTADAFAYIYLYELLCGIGTEGPTDTLAKLLAFEDHYGKPGFGDGNMRKNLRRWMLEYAVLHDLPPETARACADPELMARDLALAALRLPQEQTDEALFAALCAFAGEKLTQSPVMAEAEKGRHLFAALWRTAMRETAGQLFTDCFGERETHPWRPLSNAVYWEETPQPPRQYVLNPSRRYECRGDMWQEKRYDPLRFDRDRFLALLHEGDRQLRRWLKTGHYLREKREEAWAAPYAQALIAAEEAAAREAARPKITIDFAGLDRIRRDAGRTRDSLLTEEELAESGAEPEREGPAPAEPFFDGLDARHLQILLKLLRGESAAELISRARLMPAVVTDTINEAFYDEIGDSVVECDGSALTLVEDYREDLTRILGGTQT